MAPFRGLGCLHDPAATNGLLEASSDVSLAPPDEHPVFKSAAQELYDTLGDLPETCAKMEESYACFVGPYGAHAGARSRMREAQGGRPAAIARGERVVRCD